VTAVSTTAVHFFMMLRDGDGRMPSQL
jgi:hypothetical protein